VIGVAGSVVSINGVVIRAAIGIVVRVVRVVIGVVIGVVV
jgi:hypothetical protein